MTIPGKFPVTGAFRLLGLDANHRSPRWRPDHRPGDARGRCILRRVTGRAKGEALWCFMAARRNRSECRLATNPHIERCARTFASIHRPEAGGRARTNSCQDGGRFEQDAAQGAGETVGSGAVRVRGLQSDQTAESDAAANSAGADASPFGARQDAGVEAPESSATAYFRCRRK